MGESELYNTSSLLSGCKVLCKKLACEIPPCILQDSTVYVILSHRDLRGSSPHCTGEEIESGNVMPKATQCLSGKVWNQTRFSDSF